MKKFFAVLLALSLVAGLLPVWANAFTFGDVNTTIQYSFNDETGLLTILGTGEMPEYGGDEKPWDPFASQIRSLQVLDGVTSVGWMAFANCTALESVTLADSVEYIGVYAFGGCSNLSQISFGEGLLEIQSSAFYECTSLTSIELPDGLMYIGESAFLFCSSLSSITLPAGDFIFDTSSFACTAYFSDPANWTEDGLIYIGNHLAAADYDEIPSEIEIRPGTVSIADQIFFEYPALGEIVIPDSVTRIPFYAFNGCVNLVSVTLPEGLQIIGQEAFSGCVSLEEITLPSTLGVIGSSAFSSTGLTSVALTGVVELDEYAFYGCSSLASVELPACVSSIGENAFLECDSLTSAVFAGTEEQWGSVFVAEGNGALTGALSFAGNDFWTVTDGVLTVGDGDVLWEMPDYSTNGSLTTAPWGEYALEITSIVIGQNVANVGESAFAGLGGVDSVTIGKDVHAIAPEAFAGCSGIMTLEVDSGNTLFYSEGNCVIGTVSGVLVLGCLGSEIPATGVTSIGVSAFAECEALDSITIPDGVTSIGEGAFEGCTMLESVVLPASVVSIGEYAFTACPSFKTVNYGGSPAQFAAIDVGVGNNKFKSATIHYAASDVPGDLNGDAAVTAADAIYLLYYTFYPADYPVTQSCDYTGDGSVTAADAIYLLYYTFYPNDYPLNANQNDNGGEWDPLPQETGFIPR